MPDKFEQIEIELSDPCHACGGVGKFPTIHQWCITCGGSGKEATIQPGQVYLDGSSSVGRSLKKPAPYLEALNGKQP